ncbi:MAG: M23 family metallopeptidase [Alistipes sp.]|nr:M23 family metallopeptidase [Alistipes sp.]
MRRGYIHLVLTAAAAVGITAGASAQRLDTAYYDFPLRDVAGYYSANFGEMRPNHFHSGTDIKTDGVEGKPVVAAADGYVSRIFMSPWGYGLALYVTHPNGTTTVYGHLSRFRKDIADYVWQQRHSQRKNRVDLYCKEGTFTVKRGEEIARSGDTGSSGGPHLHFEIRDARTQKTLNVIQQGILRPKDDIAPLMMKLHYVEVDTVRNIPVHSALRTYALQKGPDSIYRPAQTSPLKVGRRGYFIVEVSDRKNDCANTYGVYRVTERLDERPIFEYRNDGFPFNFSRYCNSVSYYPIQRASRNEAIRLTHIEGGTSYFYTVVEDRGIVSAAEGESRNVVIEAADDCGNVSTLAFEIEGKPDSECFTGHIDPESDIIRRGSDFTARVDSIFSVTVPRGALYESVVSDIAREDDLRPHADTTVKVLSPAYRVLDRSIPLHKGITLTFTTPVDKALQRHTTMASVSSNGSLAYAGGSYADGSLKAQTSTLGTYCLAADLTPPTIRPSFKDGEDCRSRRTLTFRIADNFSGIGSYTASIDGRWVAVDYAPKHARATIHLDAEGITGGVAHEVSFTLTDNCGNRTVWKGSIVK